MACEGRGGDPLPRARWGSPQLVTPDPSLPLLNTSPGPGTGFPFWMTNGTPSFGAGSPPEALPHTWPWSRALTADLGTAAALGGRPLLLGSTVSVSVCSILRGPE